MSYGTFRSAVSDAAHTPERIDGVVYLLCLMPERLKASALEHVEQMLGHIPCGRVSLFEWVDWICQGHCALAQRLRENGWPESRRFAAEVCAVFAFQMSVARGSYHSFADWSALDGGSFIVTDFGARANLAGGRVRNPGAGLSMGVAPYMHEMASAGGRWQATWPPWSMRDVEWSLPSLVLGVESAVEVWG